MRTKYLLESNMTEQKYWASRIARGHDEFFWNELKQGRLRQGWGRYDEQDLRTISKLDGKPKTKEQSMTDRQRHMLGEGGGWQVGDIILIPNMPHRRMFALAKVTGPYRYEIDPEREDFGHIREVKLLTPHGIANTSKIVGSGLRSTLRNAGRTWCVRGRDAEFERVLTQANDPEVAKESTNNERVQGVMGEAIQAAIKAMRSDFDQHSANVLNNAEWEGIIANALKPLFPTSEVEKTGGPNEKGADIQITTPNPFNGPDWITVIQVKDWQGKAGPKVIQQLERAIKTRRNPDDNGRNTAHVISAVLTLGMAEPTPELEAAALDLERREGVPVTIIYGDQLLELIFSGTLQQTLL
jgi:hypothetical protein